MLSSFQIKRLRTLIDEWKSKAAAVGSQHTLWDKIWDAEALLKGEATVLSGTPDEIYRQLIGVK